MKGKCILLFGFVLVLVLLQAGLATAADDRIIVKRELSENVTVEINKDVELVYTAAVVSGYPYYYRDYTKITHAAKQYFAPNRYSDYIAQEARKRPWGIGAEHVAALIVDNDHGVPGIYDGEEAQQLREAVKKFAETTKAEVFFENHKQSYEELMDFFVSRINSSYITNLEEFFGVELSKDSSFRVILKPGLYGGHALTIKNDDGSVTYLNVMDPCGSELDCINLLYHETIHNFMSHINEAYFDLIMSYEQNNRHKLIQGYHNEYFPEMLDETIVRAITNIMVYQDGRPDLEQRLMNWYLSDGWRGTDVIYEFIKDEYLPNREKYPTFKDFFPVLLEMIDSNSLERIRPPILVNPEESVNIEDLFYITFSDAMYAINDPRALFDDYRTNRTIWGDFVLRLSNDCPINGRIKEYIRLLKKYGNDYVILRAPEKPDLRATCDFSNTTVIDDYGTYRQAVVFWVVDEDRHKINENATYTIHFPEGKYAARSTKPLKVKLKRDKKDLNLLFLPSPNLVPSGKFVDLGRQERVPCDKVWQFTVIGKITDLADRIRVLDESCRPVPVIYALENDNEGKQAINVRLLQPRPGALYTIWVNDVQLEGYEAVSTYKLEFITQQRETTGHNSSDVYTDTSVFLQHEIATNVTVEFNKDIEMLFAAAGANNDSRYFRYYSKLNAAKRAWFLPTDAAERIGELEKLLPWGINTQKVAAVLSMRDDIDWRGDFGRPTSSIRNREDLWEILNEFCRKNHANEFFEKHYGDYKDIMEIFLSSINTNYVQNLEQFFGEELSRHNRFRTILLPGISRGEAAELQNSDGSKTYLSILDPLGGKRKILNLLYHETTHNFLNRVLDEHQKLIDEYEAAIHPKLIPNYHFNHYPEKLSETITRAITNIMLVQDGEHYIESQMMDEYQRLGWRGVDVVMQFIIDEYMPNRGKYPTFSDFFPVLLEYMANNSLKLVRNARQELNRAAELDRLVFSEAIFAINDPRVIDQQRYVLERHRFGDFLLKVSNEHIAQGQTHQSEQALIRKLVLQERDTVLLEAPGCPTLRARLSDTWLELIDCYGRWSFGYAVRVLEDDRALIDESATYTVRFDCDQLAASQPITVKLVKNFDEVSKLAVLNDEALLQDSQHQLPPIIDAQPDGCISISLSQPVDVASIKSGCVQLVDAMGERWPVAVVVEPDGRNLEVVFLRDLRANRAYTAIVKNVTSEDGSSLPVYKRVVVTSSSSMSLQQEDNEIQISTLEVLGAYAWEDIEHMPKYIRLGIGQLHKEHWGDIMLVGLYWEYAGRLNLVGFSDGLYFSENRYILLISPGRPTLRARLTANSTEIGMISLFFANILPEDRDKIDSNAVYTLVLPQNSKYSIVSNKPLKIQNLGNSLKQPVDSEESIAPFSIAGLQRLAEETPVDPLITYFRTRPNPRREGHNKVSTKFFDIYYPADDPLAQMYAEEIEIYADTAYAFLMQLYGHQVPVEIFIIHEEDARGLREGDIRFRELVTFVHITDNYNRHHGAIIQNMVHEMHHNFFHVTNNMWDYTKDPWAFFVDEGIARMIQGIYSQEAFTDKPPDYGCNWTVDFTKEATYVYGRMKKLDYYPSWEEAMVQLNEYGWGPRDDRHKLARDMVILGWVWLYNKQGLEKFQEVLTTIGNANYRQKLESIYAKSLDDLCKEFYTDIQEIEGRE